MVGMRRVEDKPVVELIYASGGSKSLMRFTYPMLLEVQRLVNEHVDMLRRERQ